MRRPADAPSTPEQILNRHIAAFFRAVRELNLPSSIVRARVADWLAAPSPDHFLVIDPDDEVRRIIVTEIGQCKALPARGASLEEIAQTNLLSTAIPVCRPSKAALVRAALPVGVELITLQIRSANAWLAPWLPAPEGHLVAVVSHWPDFLDIARTMLISAGLSPDALLFRDARRPRWRSGLDHASVLLCDVYTARLSTLPRGPRKIEFPLLADEARTELGRYSASASL